MTRISVLDYGISNSGSILHMLPKKLGMTGEELSANEALRPRSFRDFKNSYSLGQRFRNPANRLRVRGLYPR